MSEAESFAKADMLVFKVSEAVKERLGHDLGHRRLRVVFGGMDGRFSTQPLCDLASYCDVVGVIHTSPRREKQSLLLRWARHGKHDGNLRAYVERLGAAFFEAGRMVSPELLAFVRYLKPDIMVLANFSIILPPDIYELPRLGTINVHMGSLPRYRGPNPWLWMFYNGDEGGEVTVHQVDDGEDTGEVWVRESFEIAPYITGSQLADEVLPVCCRALRRALVTIVSGAEPQPQGYLPDLVRARYVKPGEALIDWDVWDSARVARFLRGASLWYEPLPPVPGFLREYGEEQPLEEKDEPVVPGTARGGMFSGWIRARDGRIPYKMRIDPYEFVRLVLPIALLAFVYGFFFL